LLSCATLWTLETHEHAGTATGSATNRERAVKLDQDALGLPEDMRAEIDELAAISERFRGGIERAFNEADVFIKTKRAFYGLVMKHSVALEMEAIRREAEAHAISISFVEAAARDLAKKLFDLRRKKTGRRLVLADFDIIFWHSTALFMVAQIRKVPRRQDGAARLARKLKIRHTDDVRKIIYSKKTDRTAALEIAGLKVGLSPKQVKRRLWGNSSTPRETP
jgi:hypothetical protein